MSVRKICHEGKTVFVGIDVHKKTYAVCARGEHMAAPLKMSNLRADPVELARKLKTSFPGATIKTVYEAGFSGFVLHRVLEASGISSIVVHAAAIEIAANNKVKNDKRDADRMSLHLSLGLLKGIRIPSVDEELGRLYSRTRRQLVKRRTSIGNQIKSKLFQFGFISPNDDAEMSNKRLEHFEALDLPFELAVVIKTLGSVYRAINKEIRVLEARMKEQAVKDAALESVYRSVPGVGEISSRILANELGDMSQFANQRSLYSFVGLTPGEHSSGEMERRGRITRQGRSELRAVLVEVAWRAILKDAHCASVYAHLKQHRGGKRAIVAVARRLIGRIRGCFQRGELYRITCLPA